MALGKPVKKWEERVKFDRESSVRRCEEEPLGYAEKLGEKAPLVRPITHMLEDSRAECDFKLLVFEGQHVTRRLDERDSRVGCKQV